jgi:phosphoribosylanthranilate isomerase
VSRALWVKVCGLTTESAVAAAVAAGVDAIGFVFAPSKRQVNAQQAAQLAHGVSPAIARVAVMQHPAQALLDEVWEVFRPDVLQTDVEDLAKLRVPSGLSVMPVLRSGRSTPAVLPARLLFEGPQSGTGTTSDWNAAAELAGRTQVVLAGGLNPANVAAAIEAVRPFGVDVSSGVEAAPGVKDPAKIHAFVRNARSAGDASS